MDWFEKLTGFVEKPYAETQSLLAVDGERLTSKVNGRGYGIGRLELPSLAELRRRQFQPGRLRVRNVSGDVRALHRDPANRGTLFQVASQFNLLEMIGPSITPEHGVTRYRDDRTQGPACAIAAGGATLYRNYFAPVADRIGQTSDTQIDASADMRLALAQLISVAPDQLWEMQNGYALPSAAGLAQVSTLLDRVDDDTREELKGTLRIGLHWDVEVTDDASPKQVVSQAFCSAMPVSYSGLSSGQWAPLAQLVLEASYEATLAAAASSERGSGNRSVHLTRLGGGAFGNPDAWIDSALGKALRRFAAVDLEVVLVSYGQAPASHRAFKVEFSGRS